MRTIKYFLFLLFLLTINQGYSQTFTDSLHIFPNPVQSSATIYFSISNNDTVKLGIYNLVGKDVRTYFKDTLLHSGFYSVVFIPDTLSDGIYILKLNYGNKNKTVKFVIQSSTSGISQPEINNSGLYLYPNPVTDNAELKYTLQSEENISIQLMDIEGRTITTFIQNQNQQPGEHTQPINLPTGLASGTYLIVLSSHNEKISVKIVK